MYVLIESLRTKISQLKCAVASGEDQLVRIIDGEIEPLIDRLVEAKPGSPGDRYLQMRYLCELTAEHASDEGLVRRHMFAMTRLLDKSFHRRGDNAAKTMPKFRRSPRKQPHDDIYLYQGILDAMPDQIVLLGRDSRLLFANQAFCKAHGCRLHECIGRRFDEYEFGNGIPLDFELRVKACLDAERPASNFPSVMPSAFERTSLHPFATLSGAVIAVLVVIRNGAFLVV